MSYWYFLWNCAMHCSNAGTRQDIYLVQCNAEYTFIWPYWEVTTLMNCDECVFIRTHSSIEMFGTDANVSAYIGQFFSRHWKYFLSLLSATCYATFGSLWVHLSQGRGPLLWLFHVTLHFIRVIFLLITNGSDNIPKKKNFCVPNNSAYTECLVWDRSVYVIHIWELFVSNKT